MYVIGLTGGVGSGKTEAAKILQDITGAELLLADTLGHFAMERSSSGYYKILEKFGKRILDENEDIDRSILSDIVFGNEESLEQLNQIIHPIVLNIIEQFIEERRAKPGIIIVESAIMFESGCDQYCDEVWYIFVPEMMRISRLQYSRGYTEEKTRAVMQKQLQEEIYKNKSKRVILNTGTIEQLHEKIEDALTSSTILQKNAVEAES